MKKVGIIGGLGPETTAEFYLDVVFSCQRKSKINRPPIIISSVPMSYEIEEDAVSRNFGMGRFIPFLIEEAKRLEKAGADFLVMPCNSLHVFIDEIKNKVSIPVLSIVEETVGFLLSKNMDRVGVVSTSATLKNRLYQDAFEKNNINFFEPDQFQQAKMGKIIHNLLMGKQSNKDRKDFLQIINDFEDHSLDCIILACTDLQLLIPDHPSLKIFDTMKILADATVKNILKD